MYSRVSASAAAMVNSSQSHAFGVLLESELPVGMVVLSSGCQKPSSSTASLVSNKLCSCCSANEGRANSLVTLIAVLGLKWWIIV